MKKIALTLFVAGAVFASEARAQLLVTGNSARFRDGNCQFERRNSNLGYLFFGLRSSQRDLDRDCRVSTSRTREQGVWYPIGRDGNGNVIYERRVRDRNGRIIAERARSRDGRTLARIASNGNSRINRDSDDDSDRRRIGNSERNRVKALEKARRNHEKAVQKAQRDRARAIERARRNAERGVRRGGNGRRSDRDT